MGRTPIDPLAKVQYFEDHIPPFETNAVAIGTNAVTVTLLETKTVAARGAYDAHQVAKQAAETAALAFKNAVKAMNDVGQGILKQIDTTAETTGNPGVYTLAEVAPPATRSHRGNPSTPFGFTGQVGSTGELELKWKNSDATGAVYMIYRRLAVTGAFEPLGGVGSKSFVDDTIPAGTAVVQYRVQAVRSTGKSSFAPFTVNFGIEPGMVNLVEEAPTKLAA